MSFLAGQAVTADNLNDLATEGTYVPLLTASTTDPNLGADGTATANWHRNGLWFFVDFEFQFSGTGADAGSGTFNVSLPFPADLTFHRATPSTGRSSITGVGFTRDNDNITNSRGFFCQLSNANEIFMPTSDSASALDHDTPFIWADGDELNGSLTYLADPAGLP